MKRQKLNSSFKVVIDALVSDHYYNEGITVGVNIGDGQDYSLTLKPDKVKGRSE